ncbi:MAG: PQQ-binding-like beta-propeller repeat protein [Phycisphaerales bacterium]|nr:MAG: PQQ-binding-like beta-propeller repeat protein [Phycisphaerales bacterium]
MVCDVAGVLGGQSGSQWLVSPELVKQAALKVVWHKALPIRDVESLEQLVVLDDRIYVFSDRNHVVSLDREDGKVIFGRSIAPAGFEVMGLGHYGNELFSVIGDELVELSAEFGRRRGTKSIGVGIICPAARNSSYYYLSAVDNRLHTLHAESKVRAFQVAAENESRITSIIADETFIILGTDAGNVISLAAGEPRRLWQFDAAGPLAGPIVRDGESFFFACDDTNVYRIDMVNPVTVGLIWKYQTQGVPDRAPRVTEKVVYQYVPGRGLTAIDRQSGRFVWSLSEGVDLLTEAADKAYVITNVRTLVVMDNSRAKKLYWVNFSGVSLHAANPPDSKIYIAGKRGRVACLEPAG